jgi:hypothetical protein
VRAIVLCLPLCAACGSDPQSPTIDAPIGDPSCLIPPDYGDVGAKTGTTSLGMTTSTIVLDPGPPRDSFFLKLTSGKGVFAGGLQTGTFTIEGDDLSPSTCGLCVNILADIGSVGPAKFFFASAGTVTLTLTNPPEGELSNVTMIETTAGGTPIQGGCTSAIAAMSFETS